MKGLEMALEESSPSKVGDNAFLELLTHYKTHGTNLLNKARESLVELRQAWGTYNSLSLVVKAGKECPATLKTVVTSTTLLDFLHQRKHYMEWLQQSCPENLSFVQHKSLEDSIKLTSEAVGAWASYFCWAGLDPVAILVRRNRAISCDCNCDSAAI